MEIKHRTYNNVLYVMLSGELDENTAKFTSKRLDDLFLTTLCKQIIIDLSELEFMDSTGIGVLIGRYKKMKDKGVSIFINEINDRQQGPTETASLNNEINGLPSLQRTSFILNYGNLADARTQEYFRDIKENAERTYFAATKIPSQFYVKLMGKQPCVSAVNLQNGVYSLSKSEEGVYNWDLSNPEPEMKGVQVDLGAEQTKVCLSDVSLQENQDIQTGRQILRINGIAMPGSEPFCLEDGVSKLNPTWVPVVESLQQAIIKTQQFSAEDSLANNSSNQVVEEQ